MTLEDFFTPTELKDGLTTPTRVNELLTIMQNEKESVAKNINELSQQRSAVANTIANTENKECLDLFVQLDGLWFVNKWLNDAQNLNDSDELIISLLRVIERLQVDHDKSVSSGIAKTVEGYIGHSNSVVCEKVKALCDLWAPAVQDVDPTVEKIDPVVEENNNEEKLEESKDENMPTQEIVTESVVTSPDPDPTDVVDSSKSVSGNPTVENGSERSKVESTFEEQSDVSQMESKHVEDVSEKQEIAGAVELTTETEVKEDNSEKDEEMINGESSGDHENPKSNSNSNSSSNSESHEDTKKDDEIESENDSPKRSTKSRDVDLVKKRPSDMELDYGIVDPLELARQVANEVELEVDSQERSCSISGSENEKERKSTEVSSKEVLSTAPHPENIASTETPKQGQESEPNVEKGFSGFDLNEEFSSEENENPISTTISIVSASRAAAANGPPVAPLQFEGSLGWKGSAATSAFRRIPEVEKTVSSSSKPRVDGFDFDLNVAEGNEDRIEDFLSRDKMAIKSEKLQLDLNTFGDFESGNVNVDWKRDTQVMSLKQNGPHIDLNLNDHSNIQNIPNNNNVSFEKLFNNNNKRDESVISIFGKQVEVKRKEAIPPTRFLDPQVDFTLGRPGSSSSMPYATNVANYGHNHNGFQMGPTMYGPPPPAGQIPYMVPQLMGSTSSLPPTFSQPTQPFFFNMANGAGPSRQTFDLNDNNNNNNGGLRQFFNPTQIRPVEEQYLRMNNNNNNMNMNMSININNNSNNSNNSSSSIIGGKRQEPDSGWDLFPINYKHQQPPWQ